MWNDFNDMTLADLAGQRWVPAMVEPSQDDEDTSDFSRAWNDPETRGLILANLV